MKNYLSLIFTLVTSFLITSFVYSQDHRELFKHGHPQNHRTFLDIGFNCIEVATNKGMPYALYDLTDAEDSLKFIQYRLQYNADDELVSFWTYTTSIEVYKAYINFCEAKTVEGVKYDKYDFVYRSTTHTYLFDEDTIEGVKCYFIHIYKG